MDQTYNVNFLMNYKLHVQRYNWCLILAKYLFHNHNWLLTLTQMQPYGGLFSSM